MGHPHSTPRCQARLTQAIRTDELVQVARALPGADAIEGYVVQLGPEWVVLSVLREGAPDGWTALRTGDVRTVEPAPSGPFVQRGLQHRKSWPPQAPRPELMLEGGARGVLASVSAGFSLFLLYREQDDPDACVVGRPVGLTPARFEWLGLNPSGAWDVEPESWELSTVTRIDLGSQYALALARAAELRSLVVTPYLPEENKALGEPVEKSPEPFTLHALP